MTATTFSRLPLLAGSAVAASVGRFGLWAISHYMRAPLASTGLIAMVTLTALAGSNALYFQTARHPAPLFAPAPGVPIPVELAQPLNSPLVAPQPAQQSAGLETASTETTGSVAPAIAAPAAAPLVPNEPVGNAEVFELQKKLHELGLFEGTVDGYYGPMTARAIRAFEERNGREPTGALNRDVIDSILQADAAGIAPVQQQRVAAVTPRSAPVRQQAAPATVSPQNRVVARLPPVSPVEAAFDTVTETAATTIDSIVAAVDGGRQTPAQPAIKPIPALPLLAIPAQPMPAPVQQVASIQPPAPIQPTTTMSQQQPADQVMAPTVVSPANDSNLVSQIQRGLASLGFLVGPIDGQPGEATAKAIRSFEVFHNYQMTGQITPELPGLLLAAGATI